MIGKHHLETIAMGQKCVTVVGEHAADFNNRKLFREYRPSPHQHCRAQAECCGGHAILGAREGRGDASQSAQPEVCTPASSLAGKQGGKGQQQSSNRLTCSWALPAKLPDDQCFVDAHELIEQFNKKTRSRIGMRQLLNIVAADPARCASFFAPSKSRAR